MIVNMALEAHEAVRVLRQRLGLSQAECADLLGWSRKTVSDVENRMAIERTVESVLLRLQALAADKPVAQA